jgi:hypothetical protein
MTTPETQAPPAAQPGSGGIAHVVGQMRAERVRFMALRAAFLITILLTVGFVAWALPFVPGGLSGYDTATAVAIGLAVAAAAAWVFFIVVFVPLFQQEPLSQFLQVLFGGHQLIRGGTQFIRRLEAECRRAQRDRRHVFSLIVVRQPELPHEKRDLTELNGEPHAMAFVIRSMVRTKDIVATPSEAEVWVLTLSADQEACERVVRRLSVGLQRADWLPNGAGLTRIGASTFGVDAEAAQTLLQIAQRRLAPLWATAVEQAA